MVVNNAGYGLFGMVEETTEEQARAQLDTNLLGPLGIHVTIVEPGATAHPTGSAAHRRRHPRTGRHRRTTPAALPRHPALSRRRSRLPAAPRHLERVATARRQSLTAVNGAHSTVT
ncbi:hypothetical protein P2Q00_12085 [Streptomyces coacervatus]|uniref:hypothetical protein n=1 Tax=Streptomyces coacervatus TaxID=647381 RepID=UPI0023DC98BF|nr:hypothetical protein [Streptomyces coacervatus]MDF2266171.1 hypothetical protein [Streptomyces coacervatus]